MFNLFPSFQKPDWLTATGYTIEGVYYSPAELMNEFVKLRDQLRSIEEDGTEEHNNAIKLRQENAQLKVEIDNWKVCSAKWRELYDEKADTVDELVKEVNGLRHLKKENVELMERVNEIDSDQNEKYRAEILTLKNECTLLRSKNNTLQEFIDTKIKVDWKSARIDILERDLQKCAQERDEYKHQLNAANKENEKLKKDIIDYVYEKDEQKHPMYPLHWGGYEPEKWSTTKVAVDDAVQAKQREVYGIEEKKTFKPWVEEPVDWKKNTTTENLEERVAKLEEQLKYTQKIICPKQP